MGNPPFVGYSLQSNVQKQDIQSVYVDSSGKTYKTAGKNDYVSCWLFKAAQLILDARALYPDSSLADLYDELTMPPELRKAHQANDKAVMQAYGFDKDMTESEIVSQLMKMYQRFTEK